MSDYHPNFNFVCYVCGKFVPMPSRRKISEETAIIYEQYFNFGVVRNVNYAPSIACTTCINSLQAWSKGKRESMPFGVPMLWTETEIHDDSNCYLCVNNLIRMNRKTAQTHTYVSVPSAQIPLPHSDQIPVPKRPSPTEQYVPPTFDTFPEASHSLYQPSNVTPPCRHIEITQNRLDLMARQLKLSQARQILLTQHLKAVNILAPGVRIYDARGRQREFMKFFDRNETNTFAYCNDIPGLVLAMYSDYQYDPNDFRLFIDSSKYSLKAVLLYKDNTRSSVPIAISTETTENYQSMKKIIDSVKYVNHQWKICADLKVISLLRGLQLGWTKNMCFLCQWDTRYAMHGGNQYQKRDWPARGNHRIGHQNVINVPLIQDVTKILLPPLHIKLGLVKNFIKALVKRENTTAFARLKVIFNRLTPGKVKEGRYFYRFKKILIEFLEKLSCNRFYVPFSH